MRNSKLIAITLPNLLITIFLYVLHNTTDDNMGLSFEETCMLFKSIAKSHGIPVPICVCRDGYYFVYITAPITNLTKDELGIKLKQFFRTVLYDRYQNPFHIFICADEVFVHNIEKTRKKTKKDIPIIERELDL